MYNDIPVIFNDREACRMIALGYSKETNKEWCVVQKSVEGNDSIWYKPYITSNIEKAKTNGWIRIFY